MELALLICGLLALGFLSLYSRGGKRKASASAAESDRTRKPARDHAEVPDDDLRRLLFAVTSCDPQTNIFHILPDSLGFGVLCHPIPGGGEAVQEKLNALANLPFPAGTIMQCALYASPDVEAPLARYEDLRRGTSNTLLEEMTKQRVAFLREGTRKPLDTISNVRLHDMQVVISVRVPIGDEAPTQQQLARVHELKAAFEQALATTGVPYTALTAERYVRFMETVLNHKPTATWRESPHAEYDDTMLLSHQLLDGDNPIRVDAQGLWLAEQTRVRLLHVKRYPAYVGFGDALAYLGDVVSGARGIRENCLITLNMHYPDHEIARARIEADQGWATRNMEGKITKYVPAYKWKKESLDVLMHAVEEGDRIVHCYLGMAVFADGEDASIAAANNARTYFRELGFQLMQDEYACAPLFFQLLPFAAEAAIRQSLQRYKTFATRQALPLLPIMGPWRGTGTPIMTLISRDGQLMPVSPADGETNPHFTVTAASGAGKSFFVNEMICSYLATGARAWVIDVGGSYKNLCQLLGGQYLRFNKESRICLNPFSAVNDFNEEADQLAEIISTMAAPNVGLTEFQIPNLKRVLGAVWQKMGRKTLIDHIAADLIKEEDQRVRDIGYQLFPFTSSGEYGHFFNGENNFDGDNPFIVVELEELKGRKHLQQIVLLMVMHAINNRMYLEEIGRKKLLLIDEAWDLMATRQTRDFIITAYRRARKVGGIVGTITQSVSDYWANEGAVAILENSSNRYLLQQMAESINFVQKEGRLGLDEAGYRLLKTVHTVRGQYSEILMLTERGAGIGRLIVAPFAKLLYSTTPAEIAELARLRASGMEVKQAIQTMLERRQQPQQALRRAA